MTGLQQAPVPQASKRGTPARRFLLVANGSAHQTTPRLLSALADRLREEGHVADLRLRPLPPGVLPRLRFLLRTERRHISLLHSADVVVVHSPLALSLPTLVAARVRRRPTLSFVWDLHPESNRFAGTTSGATLNLVWLLERLALLLSTRILISTEDYRPFLGRFGRKAHVVPLWPCDPVLDPAAPPPLGDRSRLRIGFAGQVNVIRGITEGIDEVLGCWPGEVELHLFTGDARPEALAHRASSDPRLTIVEHGFTPPDRLQQQLSGLDLGWVCLDRSFPLPAFPSKILAYLCAGIPVLYTGPDLPALRQWLETYRLGLRTTAGTPIDPHELTAIRRGLSTRRGTYFAEIHDVWGTVDRLL